MLRLIKALKKHGCSYSNHGMDRIWLGPKKLYTFTYRDHPNGKISDIIHLMVKRMNQDIQKGPIYDLAVKYFETYKQPIHQVWFETKMDIYYCRTVSGEYWQIPLSDLRSEIRLLKLDGNL